MNQPANDDPGHTPLPGKIVAGLDRLARGMRAHRQAISSAAGITVLQAELLRTLADGQPPPAFTGPLATELAVSQPTVSDSLAALERKGFVVRAATPSDRRRSTYLLTPAGADLAAQLTRLDDALLTGAGRLSTAEQEQLFSGLIALIGSLLDGGVLSVARTCPSCRFFDDDGNSRRCNLLQVELRPRDYRVNCPEHEAVVA